MVTAAPPIFRDADAVDRVSQWLAVEASQEERAACSALFQLVSNASGAAAAGSCRPGSAPRPGTARARIASRPSSACRSGGGTQERPSSAAPHLQPNVYGPSFQQSMEQKKCTLRPRPSTGRTSHIGGVDAVPMGNATSPLATTTYDAFFGFRSQYPQIFCEVESATRARPAAHLTFLSEYAENMKRGCSNWKQYLKTTTDTVNKSVFPPSLAHQVAKDKGFFSWMKRQRTSHPTESLPCIYGQWWWYCTGLYYGELLTEPAATQLDIALEQAAPEQKVDILLAARVLYALLQPSKNKSTCHFVHCEQKSLTDAYYDELQKSVTKEKTMGQAPQPAVQRDVMPSKADAAAPCTLACAEGDLKQRAGRLNLTDVTTYKSAIPMKMAVKGVNRSTYTVRLTYRILQRTCTAIEEDSIILLGAKRQATTHSLHTDHVLQDFHGASAPRAIQAARNRQKLAKPVVITCPMGSCDPITSRNHFDRFCVPEAMVQKSLVPGLPERNAAETVNRVHYPVRNAKDLERNQAAVARAAADAALRKNLSTIPIPPGPQGLAFKHDGVTEQRRAYKAHPLDRAERNAASWRAKLARNGPTSTIGVTLGGQCMQ